MTQLSAQPKQSTTPIIALIETEPQNLNKRACVVYWYSFNDQKGFVLSVTNRDASIFACPNRALAESGRSGLGKCAPAS